ncbi:MAG TPA: nitroreductase family protein, partial [Candidatus Binatia bacterium]|nr:nitroreductase family protein [Candidatus Binatia bacterium]
MQKEGPVHLQHPEQKKLSPMDVIATRRSVRKYLQLPIEFQKIGHVLDAGRMAPSAGNLQDWKFILIVENEKRLQIAEACLQQFWMAQAPVHIVVVAEPKKQERYYGKRGEEVYSLLNAGAAVE